MFNAYSWFDKPQLYAAVRATSLDWAGTGEKLVALKDSPAESETLLPQKRSLNTTELSGLKERMDRAWKGPDFGGFITGANLADLKGWYHFKLNPEKTEARLEGLVLDPALAEFPPLQNPAFHLALIALLKDYPELKAVGLPFGEISDLDREALRMFWVAPGDVDGWWLTRQTFERKTDFLALMMDMVTPTWFEIRLEVEPALARLVFRLFNRYGHTNKGRLESTFTTGLLGEELEDETAPYTVVTFLPANSANSQKLADFYC